MQMNSNTMPHAARHFKNFKHVRLPKALNRATGFGMFDRDQPAVRV